MNFKKPKNDIINEVYYRVDISLKNYFYGGYNGYAGPYDDPRYRNRYSTPDEHTMRAMMLAIVEAVTVVVENVYTDQDFEEDIGLS